MLGAYNQLLHSIALIGAHNVGLALHPSNIAGQPMETVMRMRKRVLDNLTTTFASGYKTKVDLEGMLTKDAILDYRQMKTGEKYLVMPHG